MLNEVFSSLAEGSFLFPLCYRFPGSGDEGIRTPDPLLARQVLSQLSYTPIFYMVMFSSSATKLTLFAKVADVPTTKFELRFSSFSSSSLAMGLNGPFLHPNVYLSYGLKWTRTIDLTLIRRAL